MSTFISAPLLLLGGLAGAMAAGATGLDNDPPSVTLMYSQQSLATNDGVSDLYRRITFAAKQVCPELSSTGLAPRSRVAQCREQAVAVAIRQIGNSQLAALHASHSKNG
jgi:UrcA family protein